MMYQAMTTSNKARAIQKIDKIMKCNSVPQAIRAARIKNAMSNNVNSIQFSGTPNSEEERRIVKENHDLLVQNITSGKL